jgi:hypothetical protein
MVAAQISVASARPSHGGLPPTPTNVLRAAPTKRKNIMKTIITAALLAFTTLAQANTACGFPPFPPFGMVYVCVCDRNMQNCQWVLVSKR